ncbi:MAG: restriction endonuclease subunit R [Candidatus Cloacimonadota bacterium]|nr:restriction endonuclease subunit R [Candidatus Cloacimonadota bacterium]
MKDKIISFTESLKSDRRIETFDEAATKQAIVLRLLSLLGWDTFNISEVSPEYSVGSQRVDYSLRINNSNKVFIEVKKISEELENHQAQLLNYSFQEGVKLAVLTNGITWWFYLPLNEGSWEQRKFYSIDLLQQESENVADRFIDFLSKENVSSGQAITNAEAIYTSQKKKNIIQLTIKKAWNKIISESDDLLVDLLNETTEKLCGYKATDEQIENFLSKNKDSLIISEIQVQKPVSYPKTEKIQRVFTKTKSRYSGKSISSFIFRGTEYEVRFWKDVLITLCDVIVSTNKNEFDKVLSLVGRKRPYYTKNGNELRKHKKIKHTNIYVETNLSANSIVDLCYRTISLFGYSKNDLKINAK